MQPHFRVPLCVRPIDRRADIVLYFAHENDLWVCAGVERAAGRLQQHDAGAFGECAALTNIVMGSAVTSIGNYAFSGCTGLTGITLPDSVTRIGWYAFNACTGLTDITLPDRVTSIGNGAFYGCSGLTRITLPAGVTDIGYDAFSDCSSLTSAFFKGNAPYSPDGIGLYYTPATLYYLSGSTGWDTEFDGRPALCWNPQVQHDASFGFATDCFGFNITGTPDIPLVIQATTNLVSGIWTPLTNATLGTSGSLHFSDTTSSSAPARFYRIVWP